MALNKLGWRMYEDTSKVKVYAGLVDGSDKVTSTVASLRSDTGTSAACEREGVGRTPPAQSRPGPACLALN